MEWFEFGDKIFGGHDGIGRAKTERSGFSSGGSCPWKARNKRRIKPMPPSALSSECLHFKLSVGYSDPARNGRFKYTAFPRPEGYVDLRPPKSPNSRFVGFGNDDEWGAGGDDDNDEEDDDDEEWKPAPKQGVDSNSASMKSISSNSLSNSQPKKQTQQKPTSGGAAAASKWDNDDNDDDDDEDADWGK